MNAVMSGRLIVKKTLDASKIDCAGRLRLGALMNELQGVADMHATRLGAGREYCGARNISWVATHMALEISEMPSDMEELTIATWPSGRGNLRAARDFEIRGNGGRLLVAASSQWIMIDLAARRPVKLADNLPEWTCVPERALDVAFGKFAEFEPQKTVEFGVRYDDIDLNRHVNNAVYAVWAAESLGYDFLNSRALRGLKVNFKKEIPAGTKAVSVGVRIDGASTRHIVVAGGLSRAVIECEWT